MNGMYSYQLTLDGLGYSVTTEDVFGDWTVANFIDDTSVPDGQYGYHGETMPPFFPFRTFTSYPGSVNGTVANLANDYIRLVYFAGEPTIGFNGQDGRDFRVAVMAIDPVKPTLVHWPSLDTANDFFLQFHDAFGYEQVVISVANVNLSGTSSYSVEVGDMVTGVPGRFRAAVALKGSPNPFNPGIELSFALEREAEVRLTVFDLRGRRVASLLEGTLPAGPRVVRWDAVDLPAGSYLARLEIDGRPASQLKLALVK